ncbi:quinone oxidoreductase family protein [Cupriavidus consociatus]|uniref:quinone oxidoreductase family protein n=1 Tax=Cupriavidus consociatus TaxID=2821357 RepID=UPI001AE6B8FE|nr:MULTISPECIES: quinone oxidoreductase [unclassified Cupriavidus]MBP0624361.1 quinone oxidoreductase [Cupriavidus sp. LEh25]MDK2661076.1 quinone oxidoreductase [Cupriavidus sp. LEh21]
MSKTSAIRIHETGGPEVMQWAEVELAGPRAGEVQVRHHAVGVNFIDVYFRSGLYAMPLPGGIGMEAAGVVTAVGDGVTSFRIGDRVAYAGSVPGSYALDRSVPEGELIHIPEGVDFEEAAAITLQGLTTQYLLRRAYRVKAGDTILVHAAAGGVGLLVCQWARALGARVIGTVSSDEKAGLARANGCDFPIVYSREDFVQRVREITGGAGVPVVYDSVGKDTYVGSLDCLAPLGTFVSFGNASGPLPPIEAFEFTRRGSLFFTRPQLFHYAAHRADLDDMAADLFSMMQSGAVKANIGGRYALADAVQVHRALESRKTTGSSVLIP